MKFTSYKIINLAFIVIYLALYEGGKIYWQAHCVQGDCSIVMKEVWLRPIIWGSLALIPIFALLLIFPSRVFKYWLFGIFSWALPLSLYLESQVDIYSSSILSISTGQLAWFLGEIFFYLTNIFILGVYLYEYKNKKIAKKDLLWLLILIPAVLIGYMIYR